MGDAKKLKRETIIFIGYEDSTVDWDKALKDAAIDYAENNFTQKQFIGDISRRKKLRKSDFNLINDVYVSHGNPYEEVIASGQANLINFIKRSNVIVDVANPGRYLIVDLTNGETEGISLKAIPQLISNSKQFLEDATVYAKFDYNPHRSKLLRLSDREMPVYNTYLAPEWKNDWFFNGSKVPFVKSLPKIYKDYFEHLTGGDRKSFNYLVDWLANSLKDRNRTILTAIGGEGIGKGILSEIMQDLHGEENFVKVRDSVFKSKFNSQFEGRTLVYVDEVDLKSKEAIDRIKDVVNPFIEIEAKGVDARNIENHASFYLTSNRADAVRIPQGDRRYSVIQLTEKKLKDTSIYKKYGSIDSYVNEGLRTKRNINLLAGYLFNKKINQSMVTPFKSKLYFEIQSNGLNNWEHYLVYEWSKSNRKSQVSIIDIQSHLCTKFKMPKPPTSRSICSVIKEYCPQAKISGESWKEKIQIG